MSSRAIDPRGDERGRMSTRDVLTAVERRGGEEERKDQENKTQQTAGGVSLFSPGESEKMRTRWQDIQTMFVDEPRRAVEEADELVASTIQRLAETFASERSRMEKEWDRGDEVSTEDLRLALQRYRSFFDRLLSI